jgi:hypothetical protein
MKIIKLQKLIFISLTILLVFSCTRMGRLNNNKHVFGILPTKIIWIQVAGLQDEHLAFLKFYRPLSKNSSGKTQEVHQGLENINCLGKMWTYNIYELRPNPKLGFMSQITGKKNIKNNCTDYAHRPIWSYMNDNGYQSAVLENFSENDHGLDSALICPQGPQFLKNLLIWQMRPKGENVKSVMSVSQEKISPKNPNGKIEDQKSLSIREKERNSIKTGEWRNLQNNNENIGDYQYIPFSIQNPPSFRPQQIYYDRTCDEKDCYNSFSRNVEFLFENFRKNRNQYLFLIRDFRLFNALKNKKSDMIKESLSEIDKIYRYFLNFLNRDTNMLIMITSTSPRNVEFPESAADWAKFEVTGNPLLYKNTSLLSLVLAKGARSENFCGMFEESELLLRMTQYEY